MTLEEAQAAKLDLVCRKIGLEPGDRFLDVGCGWGSLSLYAAEHFGAQVTGVTIAAEQKAFIDARIAERGLGDRVEIRLQDYRDVTDGPYDAVASIEMGEHVGQANYPTYVEVLRRNVKPQGRVLIQQMSRRGRHPGGGPFIESFIAPDMHMRPVGETVELIEAGGLEVRDVHMMREHYVATVRDWLASFEANQDRLRELLGEEALRVWRLYLVGGAMAFRDGRMGVDQILSVRNDDRRALGDAGHAHVVGAGRRRRGAGGRRADGDHGARGPSYRALGRRRRHLGPRLPGGRRDRGRARRRRRAAPRHPARPGRRVVAAAGVAHLPPRRRQGGPALRGAQAAGQGRLRPPRAAPAGPRDLLRLAADPGRRRLRPPRRLARLGRRRGLAGRARLRVDRRRAAQGRSRPTPPTRAR